MQISGPQEEAADAYSLLHRYQLQEFPTKLVRLVHKIKTAENHFTQKSYMLKETMEISELIFISTTHLFTKLN